MAQVNLQELLEAGVHFGHQARRWNPKMKPYIYTEREGVHIIDLGLTAEKLQAACDFVKTTVKNGGSIIFIGTKRQAKSIIEEEAKRCGAFYINQRWLGGTLTNWDQISQSLKVFRESKEKRAQGGFGEFTKKERSLIDKKIEKSQKFLGGVQELKEPPKTLFIIDTNREVNAVLEANKKGIPVVAIIDTNSDPDNIDYPIPANDDAIRSIRLITQTIANAVLEGKEEYEKIKPQKAETQEKEVKKEEVKEERKETKEPVKQEAKKEEVPVKSSKKPKETKKEVSKSPKKKAAEKK